MLIITGNGPKTKEDLDGNQDKEGTGNKRKGDKGGGNKGNGNKGDKRKKKDEDDSDNDSDEYSDEDEDSDDSSEDGYDDGYDDGYEDGYEDGGITYPRGPFFPGAGIGPVGPNLPSPSSGTNLCGNPMCSQGGSFICAQDYNRIVQPLGYPGVPLNNPPPPPPPGYYCPW
jgi:hypothetical protein